MSKKAVAASSAKNTKKGIRKKIEEKLRFTLADYKSLMGEKKFETRVRKTARMLVEDLIGALKKKKGKKKEKNVKEKSS
jgi:hypothetical protein